MDEQNSTPNPNSNLTDEAAGIDAAFPVARVQDFTAPYHGDDYTPTVQQRDLTIREGLVEARMPVGLGNVVYAEMMRVEKQTAGMTEGEREIYKRTENAKFERMHGAQAEPMTRITDQLVRELEVRQPGFASILKGSDALSSAVVRSHLGLHAVRLDARKKG